MKLLFTADLHIKVGQKKVPREWQKNRYRMLFSKLTSMAKEVDLVVIGGDIFDKVPNIEELELYFELISCLQDTRTILYDGNHEATRKGKTFLWNLSSATTKINPNVEILHGIHSVEDIDFIPYTHIKTLKSSDKYSGNILCTHVRGNIEPHVKAEIDLSLLEKWDVVLAGDLHSYSNSQLNILYPGSPISTSFHRTSIDNGVLLFDTVTKEHEFVTLGLPQLLRKTVDSESDILETSYDHTIYELTGDLSTLSSVSTDNVLLDKKIAYKGSEATLTMNNLSIVDELTMYLTKVLNLQKNDIASIIGTHNDYIKEA